jgi:hypothetical protein
VTTDLNTLLTGLYVKIDDYLGTHTRAGRPRKLTDAELLTLAVAQALLGFRFEARWLRFVPRALPAAFPYLPGQSGYNKRLRNALPLIKRLIRVLAADTDLWADPLWLVDSTPVECARSRPHRETLELGRPGRLQLLPVALAVLLGAAPALDHHDRRAPDHLGAGRPETRRTPGPHGRARPRPHPVTQQRPGLTVIADKGYVSAELDRFLAERGVRLLRPSYRNRTPRPGEHLLKPVRQLIESVFDTLKGQLDIELHGGRSIDGVGASIGQRLLALTAAIWHNRATGQHVTRSLIAYDH